MQIAGQKFRVIETYDRIVTVPDCFVVRSNKIGHGNGEAKLYFGPRESMMTFFGQNGATFKNKKCFLVKQDLINYLKAVETEYKHPSFQYHNSSKEDLTDLWSKRISLVDDQPEIIEFTINDQQQIAGQRGYIKSSDFGYQLIRELSLPLITYISVMEVADESSIKLYYFRLFVDFDAIGTLKNGPLVLHYGNGKAENTSKKEVSKPGKSDREDSKRLARIGQGKYRERLLEECPFCPITLVNEERLLIASHIKPWAVSDDKEKVDPKNGYMLSPLYDKLFDRGFITFTNERKMLVSNWLSPSNQNRLYLKNNKFYPRLPMDDERKKYLSYHKQFVFMG